MKFPRVLGRRFFLLGLGGATLAIPRLTSLSPGHAQEPSQKRFISYRMKNGFFGQHWYPSDEAVESIGGFRRLGEHVIGVPLSELPGPMSTLLHEGFDPLRDKISVLRHIDQLNWADHNNYTGLLGWRESRLPDDPSRMAPSIDQIMGEHLFGGTSRPLNMAASWGRGAPSCSFTIGPSGPVMAPGLSGEEAFQLLFSSDDLQPSVADQRRAQTASVIDHVLPHYRSVRDNRRLSRDDRFKLDQHIEHMHEVSMRLGMGRAECAAPDAPERLRKNAETITTLAEDAIDVGIAALRCGLTQIVNFFINPDVLFDGALHGVFGGHHGASHNGGAQGVESVKNAHLWHMERVLRILNGLNDTETEGGTLLDESVFFLNNEIGNQAGRDNTPGNYDLNHSSYDTQVLVAGSCGGALQTGQYLDYRTGFERGRWTRHVGAAFNKVTISMMLAMGLRPEHWEVDGQPGHGDMRGDQWGRTPLDEVYIGDLREGLPGLMA